jgi:hypothetical protein
MFMRSLPTISFSEEVLQVTGSPKLSYEHRVEADSLFPVAQIGDKKFIIDKELHEELDENSKYTFYYTVIDGHPFLLSLERSLG